MIVSHNKHAQKCPGSAARKHPPEGGGCSHTAWTSGAGLTGVVVEASLCGVVLMVWCDSYDHYEYQLYQLYQFLL